MNNYVIFTDSGSDLPISLLSKMNIESANLSFYFSEQDYSKGNEEFNSSLFYSKLRNGKTAKTSAVNPERFKERFLKIMNSGNDILYLGFSSALSSTYNSARIAMETVRKENPKSKIIIVDTKSASLGLGLIVYLTSKKKSEGASIEAAAEFAKNLIKNVCHWFTVEDLSYLKRGGRISHSSAFFGNMLGIKPIMYMDNGGYLKPYDKVRGRLASIEELARKYGENHDTDKGNTVFISHADCIQDAKLLGKILYDNYGAKTELIADIGAVIGSHAGPGTLALFFIGKSR